jgi:glycerol kinase
MRTSERGRVCIVIGARRWVEQDPLALLATVRTCLQDAARQLHARGYDVQRDVKGMHAPTAHPGSVAILIGTVLPAAVGITNQRETTILWDAATGEPLHPAIGEWASSPVVHR